MSENTQREGDSFEPSSPDRGTKRATMNKNKITFIAVGAVVLVATFFGLKQFGILGGNHSGSGLSGGDPDKVVATATSGITITRGELDKKIEQVKRSLPEGSVDPAQDAAFELQLLNDMVSLKLLIARATEKNYTVTDEEVEAEKTKLIEQVGGEVVFETQLNTLGITKEELHENMKNELLIRQLLNEETDVDTIVVSDEEIKEAYDIAVQSAGENAEGIPTLEESSEFLRSDIVNRKSAEMIEEYLAGIKESAGVEILL